MSSYDPIAYYYDLEYRQVTGDLDFYREMARQVGAQAKILEIACGSGRVVLPLLQAGFRVTGLDNSSFMLDLARQKVAGMEPQLQNHAHFVQAEMQNFDLGNSQFDLIFIALNSFLHLLTQVDQLNCLKTIRRHLAPTGLFIVDIFNPEEKDTYPADGRLEYNGSFSNPQTGGTVYVSLSTTANPAEQLRHATYFYDEAAQDGSLKRTVSHLTLRYIYRYEMQLLLERAGFSVEELYGSYEFDEFSSDSGKLVFVCRRG